MYKKINFINKLLIFTVFLLFVGLNFVKVTAATKTYSFYDSATGIKKATTSFGGSNGTITCLDGTMTYNVKNSAGNSIDYGKVRFTTVNNKVQWTEYSDVDEKNIRATGNTSYDFQSILDKSKNGFLTIRFYKYSNSNAVFTLSGAYRIYKNTTLTAPNNDITSPSPEVILKKFKNVFSFINTDDEAASKFSGGIYNGDGNITFSNLIFDMNRMNSQIGKFIHAKNIKISKCLFKNGTYNAHVFEFACMDTVKVTDSIFKDLLVSSAGSNTNITAKTADSFKHEVIQIEGATLAGFPYCKFPAKYYNNTSNGNNCRSNNISISNCNFSNIVRGIGTHGGSYSNGNGDYQTNITINSVTFRNVIENSLNLQGYYNVKITGNTRFINTRSGFDKSSKASYDVNIVKSKNIYYNGILKTSSFNVYNK